MALNSAVCTAPDETGANLSASGEAIRVPAESPDLALRRAIALDRNNQAALVGLAAMTLDERNAVSTYVLLEEAARVGPVPPDVEALRQALFEQTRLEMEVRPYLRAIGRVPAPRAEHSRRILVATNLFPPQELGGYGRMMWEYAHGLKARGHDVHVLTADALTWAKPPAPDEAEMETGVRRKLKLFGGWKDGQTKLATAVDIAARNLENVASMGEAIRDFTPDVVLAGNLDLVGVGIVEAALTAGVPVLHAVANAMPGYERGRAAPVAPLLDGALQRLERPRPARGGIRAGPDGNGLSGSADRPVLPALPSRDRSPADLLREPHPALQGAACPGPGPGAVASAGN